MAKRKTPYYDYIIVGSGIAGLYMALLARELGTVLVLTKGGIEDSNTMNAQGGVAAAMGEEDSPGLHFQDTMAAGAGLCDPYRAARKGRLSSATAQAHYGNVRRGGDSFSRDSG